ncbi:hypothetical protein GMRT_10353 [Giardia muris]|uniref:Uncharacterized protein n=1 Tax=Giardia muris TaxID=5742 RepID=A0A4Z1SLD6_GIAMU|nr:hypothetical protein GMRT_10353 [Giardia muris]|eukprot:TNJ26454.1 hypothetical protein GMRT_10353 [Giardia muris]
MSTENVTNICNQIKMLVRRQLAKRAVARVAVSCEVLCAVLVACTGHLDSWLTVVMDTSVLIMVDPCVDTCVCGLRVLSMCLALPIDTYTMFSDYQSRGYTTSTRCLLALPPDTAEQLVRYFRQNRADVSRGLLALIPLIISTKPGASIRQTVSLRFVASQCYFNLMKLYQTLFVDNSDAQALLIGLLVLQYMGRGLHIFDGMASIGASLSQHSFPMTAKTIGTILDCFALYWFLLSHACCSNSQVHLFGMASIGEMARTSLLTALETAVNIQNSRNTIQDAEKVTTEEGLRLYTAIEMHYGHLVGGRLCNEAMPLNSRVVRTSIHSSSSFTPPSPVNNHADLEPGVGGQSSFSGFRLTTLDILLPDEYCELPDKGVATTLMDFLKTRTTLLFDMVKRLVRTKRPLTYVPKAFLWLRGNFLGHRVVAGLVLARLREEFTSFWNLHHHIDIGTYTPRVALHDVSLELLRAVPQALFLVALSIELFLLPNRTPFIPFALRLITLCFDEIHVPSLELLLANLARSIRGDERSQMHHFLAGMYREIVVFSSEILSVSPRAYPDQCQLLLCEAYGVLYRLTYYYRLHDSDEESIERGLVRNAYATLLETFLSLASIDIRLTHSSERCHSNKSLDADSSSEQTELISLSLYSSHAPQTYHSKTSALGLQTVYQSQALFNSLTTHQLGNQTESTVSLEQTLKERAPLILFERLHDSQFWNRLTRVSVACFNEADTRIVASQKASPVVYLEASFAAFLHHHVFQTKGYDTLTPMPIDGNPTKSVLVALGFMRRSNPNVLRDEEQLTREADTRSSINPIVTQLYGESLLVDLFIVTVLHEVEHSPMCMYIVALSALVLLSGNVASATRCNTSAAWDLMYASLTTAIRCVALIPGFRADMLTDLTTSLGDMESETIPLGLFPWIKRNNSTPSDQHTKRTAQSTLDYTSRLSKTFNQLFYTGVVRHLPTLIHDKTLLIRFDTYLKAILGSLPVPQPLAFLCGLLLAKYRGFDDDIVGTRQVRHQTTHSEDERPQLDSTLNLVRNYAAFVKAIASRFSPEDTGVFVEHAYIWTPLAVVACWMLHRFDISYDCLLACFILLFIYATTRDSQSTLSHDLVETQSSREGFLETSILDVPTVASFLDEVRKRCALLCETFRRRSPALVSILVEAMYKCIEHDDALKSVVIEALAAVNMKLAQVAKHLSSPKVRETFQPLWAIEREFFMKITREDEFQQFEGCNKALETSPLTTDQLLLEVIPSIALRRLLSGLLAQVGRVLLDMRSHVPEGENSPEDQAEVYNGTKFEDSIELHSLLLGIEVLLRLDQPSTTFLGTSIATWAKEGIVDGDSGRADAMTRLSASHELPSTPSDYRRHLEFILKFNVSQTA